MKRNRKDFSKLVSKLQETKGNAGSGSADERFWKPERDKAGNGYAVIRFLPPTDGDDDLYWVRVWSHSFQGPGGWFIENCRTTLGNNENCPVCDANRDLWNSGIEADKNIARDRKRKLTYISNIYVVSDPANPQNEGKVFLYKYGKSIYNIINEALEPQFEDEEPLNPFDFWEGANFKIKIRNKDGYVNYDKSEFDSQSQLDEDEVMEKIWKSQYKLSDFIAPDQFKSFEDQEARLSRVLGEKRTGASAAKAAVVDEFDEDVPMDFGQKQAPKAKSKPEPSRSFKEEEDTVPFDVDDDDDDDTMSYFKKLAEED